MACRVQSVVLLACLGVVSSANSFPPNYLELWEQFKNEYGKVYNGVNEEKTRFGIFKTNVDFIYAENGKDLAYRLGVNQFTDLTADEFKETYMGYKKPQNEWGDLPNLGEHIYSGETLADSVDWTQKGAVTPVKNQGQCGSCWAFSTTGGLEGRWKIASGQLVSISEQQLVDCDKRDSGCGGGIMESAFSYAEGSAMCTESSYRYTARAGSCRSSSCSTGIPRGGVTGYKKVSRSASALMSAVQEGPVSVAVDAGRFQSYRSGVLTGSCGTSLDHGVLVVGYGTSGGTDYWKVKNSWGQSFGESGYIRLSRQGDMCGILDDASYPQVSSGPNYDGLWKDFKDAYGKVYNGDEDARFKIFKANVEDINAENAKNLTYTLGINQFTDLTAEEFIKTYTGYRKPDKVWGDLPNLGEHIYNGETLADSVDWTQKGAVTPVKNQGQCGSCWAFSTTGGLEGRWKIASGQLVSLSEQQLVDCDKRDSGCGGGIMESAFSYAEGSAMCTESSYRYTARAGSCRSSSCSTGIPRGGVTGYKKVSKSASALMSAVQEGPVSVAVDASKFQSYRGGVLTAYCGTSLDHGVLVVGYGTAGGTDYWKVKNSWGSSFGEAGYIRLTRRGDECGILDDASYPEVSSTASSVVV